MCPLKYKKIYLPTNYVIYFLLISSVQLLTFPLRQTCNIGLQLYRCCGTVKQILYMDTNNRRNSKFNCMNWKVMCTQRSVSIMILKKIWHEVIVLSMNRIQQQHPSMSQLILAGAVGNRWVKCRLLFISCPCPTTSKNPELQPMLSAHCKTKSL